MTAAVVVMPVQQVHRRCWPGARLLRVCRFAVHATSDRDCGMTIHTPSHVEAPARKPAGLSQVKHGSNAGSVARPFPRIPCPAYTGVPVSPPNTVTWERCDANT